MNCKLHTLLRHYHPPQDHVVEHTHTVYELVMYLNGSGTTSVNHVAYQYRDRSIMLIAPNEAHDETSDTDSNVLFCSFELQNAHASFGSTFLPDTGEGTNRVYDVLCRMEEELRGQAPGYEEMINYQLGEMVVLLERMLGEKRTNANIIEYTKRMLFQNANRGVDLHIVAESIGYSYDRFRHLFKENTGQSPTQYVIGLRIAHAKQLLANSNLSVKQVSLRCGFKDLPNFIVAFKQRTYVTPAEYRKLVAVAERGEVVNIHDWTMLEERRDKYGDFSP